MPSLIIPTPVCVQSADHEREFVSVTQGRVDGVGFGVVKCWFWCW